MLSTGMLSGYSRAALSRGKFVHVSGFGSRKFRHIGNKRETNTNRIETTNKANINTIPSPCPSYGLAQTTAHTGCTNVSWPARIRWTKAVIGKDTYIRIWIVVLIVLSI